MIEAFEINFSIARGKSFIKVISKSSKNKTGGNLSK